MRLLEQTAELVRVQAAQAQTSDHDIAIAARSMHWRQRLWHNTGVLMFANGMLRQLT